MERLEWLGVLAKQVLSQLSYTPTVGTPIDVKAFLAVRKLQKLSRDLLPRQYCFKTHVVGPLVRQNA